MKNHLKEGFFSTCDFLGLTEYYRRRYRYKITILMYHGVVKTALKPFCWTQIPELKIEFQLKHLKNHYTILKLSDVMYRIQKSLPLPDNTAVITFDDGYKNNLTIAYPLLRRFQIPATIFLVTQCISERQLCWPDTLYLGIKNTEQKSLDLRNHGLKLYTLRSNREKGIAEQEIIEYLKSISYLKKDSILNEIMKLLRIQVNLKGTPFELLTWEEIMKMNGDDLIEFGAHTANHNILSQMDDMKMEEEINESCGAIEKHLGRKCLVFAYPNGREKDFNSKAKYILKAKEIMCGLSTIPGLNRYNEDRFELRRVSVGSDISNARFKCLVSGLLFRFKNLN